MKNLLIFVFLSIFLITKIQSHKNNIKKCTGDERKGDICHTKIKHFHPTQAVVGNLWVSCKKEILENEEDIDEYLLDHAIPTVIAPDGKYYLTDHHHLLRAAYRLKGKDFHVYTEIIANWKDMDMEDFHKKLKENHYVWLYNESENKIDFEDLPKYIWDCQNTPYRSLSGCVQHAGGYLKDGSYFQEFHWGKYFFNTVNLNYTTDTSVQLEELKNKIQFALNLTKKTSSPPSNLPGYNQGEEDRVKCELLYDICKKHN